MLVEKFRPRHFEDFILSEDLSNYVQNALRTRRIQHTLLYGRAGTGKSSLIQFLIANLGDPQDALIINASEKRGIDVVRDEILPFASSYSFSDTLRFVDLREAEKLTKDAQDALKDIIEENHDRCIFLLSTNNPHGIIEPIRSRCASFMVSPPDIASVCKRVWKIVTDENIVMTKAQVKELVSQFFPDVRTVINALEKSLVDNEYRGMNLQAVQEEKFEAIINLINGHAGSDQSTTFKRLRSKVLELELFEIDALYTYLVDNVERFMSEDSRCFESLVTIAEYMHNSERSIDKATTASAMLAHLLQIKSY